jgi:hypothetical protein
VVHPLTSYSHDPGLPTAPLPEAARVQRVTLGHPSAQIFELSIEFAHGIPSLDPVAVPDPGGRGDVPVSLGYDVVVLDLGGAGERRVSLSSPTDSASWKSNDPGTVLVSAQSTGNVVKLVIDVGSGQPAESGEAPVTPSVLIDFDGTGTPTAQYPANESWTFDSEDCFSATRRSGGPNHPSPTTPSSVPAQSTGGWGLPSQNNATRAPGPGGGWGSPSRASSAPSSLPDADAHGFVGYPGGRCLDTDLALAMGRTKDSLVVICQHNDEPPYYVGFGLGNGLPIVIPKASRYYDTGFVVINVDTQYTITRDSMTIYQPATGNNVEPMIEYWPR